MKSKLVFAMVVMVAVAAVATGVLRDAGTVRADPPKPTQPFWLSMETTLGSGALGAAGGTIEVITGLSEANMNSKTHILSPIGTRLSGGGGGFFIRGGEGTEDRDLTTTDYGDKTGFIVVEVDSLCDGNIDLLGQVGAGDVIAGVDQTKQSVTTDSDGLEGTEPDDFLRNNTPPLWSMFNRNRADLTALFFDTKMDELGDTSIGKGVIDLVAIYLQPVPLNGITKIVPWRPGTSIVQTTLAGSAATAPGLGSCQDSPQTSISMTSADVSENPPLLGDSGSPCPDAADSRLCADKQIHGFWVDGSSIQAAAWGAGVTVTLHKEVLNSGPESGNFHDQWVVEQPLLYPGVDQDDADGSPVTVAWDTTTVLGDCTKNGVDEACPSATTSPDSTLHFQEEPIAAGDRWSYEYDVTLTCPAKPAGVDGTSYLLALKNFTWPKNDPVAIADGPTWPGITTPTFDNDIGSGSNVHVTPIQLNCGDMVTEDLTEVDKEVISVDAEEPTGGFEIDGGNTNSVAQTLDGSHLQLEVGDEVRVTIEELKVNHYPETVEGEEWLDAEAPDIRNNGTLLAGADGLPDVELQWVPEVDDFCTLNGVSKGQYTGAGGACDTWIGVPGNMVTDLHFQVLEEGTAANVASLGEDGAGTYPDSCLDGEDNDLDGTLLDSGTAESGTSTTLTDDDKSWTDNEFKARQVGIVAGTGNGQWRSIKKNTSDTLTVTEDWTTNPSSDSQYEIRDLDNLDAQDSDCRLPGNQIEIERDLLITCKMPGIYPVVIKAVDAPKPPYMEQLGRKSDNISWTVINVYCWDDDANMTDGNAPITGAPPKDGIDDATGLYLRWMGSASAADHVKPFDSTNLVPDGSAFLSDTAYYERRVFMNCLFLEAPASADDDNKVSNNWANWPEVTDADHDCLQDPSTAQPGHPVDGLDDPSGAAQCLADTLGNIVYSEGTGVSDLTVANNDAQDQDCDGLLDGIEKAFGSNPNVDDTDGDGSLDFVEMFSHTNPSNPDSDDDGIWDAPEDDYVAAPFGSGEGGEANNADDNCPGHYNPGQENNDGKRPDSGPNIPPYIGGKASNPNADTLGDVCDSDDDNDAGSDVWELAPIHTVSAGCPLGALDPFNPDSDGDHTRDGVETMLGSDPCVAGTTAAALTASQVTALRGGGLNVPTELSLGGLWDDENDSDGVGTDCGTENDREEDTDDDGLCSLGDGGTDVDNDDGSAGAPAEIRDIIEVKGYYTRSAGVETDGDQCADWIEIIDVDGNRQANILDVVQVAQAAFKAEPTLAGASTGTAESGAASTLTDSDQTWAVDEWKDKTVEIVAGTGAGDANKRYVASNTADELTVTVAWTTVPDATSQYKITEPEPPLEPSGILLDADKNGQYNILDVQTAGLNSSLVKAHGPCKPPTAGFTADDTERNK